MFTKNSSTFGGAIFVLGNSANSVKNYLTISNSSFTSNKSTSDGGAIYADKNSYIQIIDTDFKNNISGGRGGAIFINGGAEVSIIADTKNPTPIPVNAILLPRASEHLPIIVLI